MQNDWHPQAIYHFATWLDRLIGDRLPEKDQDRAACVWLFSDGFWMTIYQK